MSIKFNLLLLHRVSDVHPRSWICINGRNIHKLFHKLEKFIEKENNINRETLSKIIAKKFNCSHNIIKTLLQGKKRYYPIPVILEMARIYKNSSKILERIENNIEYIKVNSALGTEIRGIKKLNLELAKIIGAFMADGSLCYQIIIENSKENGLLKIMNSLKKARIKFSNSYSKSRSKYYISFFANYKNFHLIEKILSNFNRNTGSNIQTHYTIEIIDGYKENIETFNKWIKDCFGVDPTKFEKRGNAWRSIFSNKILARYLICFFDIKAGYKADVAYEPESIKKAGLKIRKAFALGVLTFDGCATLDGKISFGTKSKYLFQSISNIFREDFISYSTKTSSRIFFLITHKKNDSLKINEYFESNTPKWLRIIDTYKQNEVSINFQNRYKTYNINKVSFDDLLETLNDIKSCDINFLANYFKCKHLTIMNYLNILRNNNKVLITRTPSKLNPNTVNKSIGILLKDDLHNKIFFELKTRFLEYKEFSKYMGINNGTLSAWKVRKNRIPLERIETICKSLNIDIKEIYNNVQETDRLIVEII